MKTSTARFLLPSLAGLLVFLTPIPTGDGFDIGIGIVVGQVREFASDVLPALVTAVVCASAALSLYGLLARPRWRREPGGLARVFVVSPAAAGLRIAAAVAACMVLFDAGPDWIASADTGGVILRDLMTVVFVVFLFASVLLPLLTDFGLMEFVGTLAQRAFRPLLTLPGAAAVDCAASWFGSSTVGVVITAKQYDAGRYTQREAAVIALNFSVVSVAFAKVIVDFAGLGAHFFAFYGALVVSGLAAAIVTPRLPPLSRKLDRYAPGAPRLRQDAPDAAGTGLFALGLGRARARAAQSPPWTEQLRAGTATTFDIWFGLLPLVMIVGTLSLAAANHTPVFDWLSYPLVFFVEFLGLPEARAAAPALLVGFADQFLPVVLAQGIDSELTRFVVACASATQLVYMSEVGAFLLRSNLPVGFRDLLAVFLLRTAITVPICALLGHWVL